MQKFEPSVSTFAPQVGAEATVELTSWCGMTAIRKIRSPKNYRNQELDRRLRSKRTKQEVLLLHEAKLAGVECPQVYFADPVSSEIIMEYVRGTTLKNLIDGLRRGESKIETASLHCKLLGRAAAKLHKSGLIHGDLTTKNALVEEDKELIVLLDFGLSFVSERLEDKAEDLHLLKQALKSSSVESIAKRLFQGVLRGYAEISGQRQCTKVQAQIAEIEKRGRYARVD